MNNSNGSNGHSFEELPVVLLHGTSGRSEEWSQVVEQLASHRSVIRLSYAEPVGSTDIANTPGTSDFAERVVAAARASGRDRFDLVGYSLGAAVSGSSTQLSEGRPEYDSSVGAAVRFQRSYNGRQPGDPAKAAAALLHVASFSEPPLRLLLGSDSYAAAEKSALDEIESDRNFKETVPSGKTRLDQSTHIRPLETQVLGGIERLSFQMNIASLPHAKRMHAIKLLGAKVAPAIRGHSLAVSTAEE